VVNEAMAWYRDDYNQGLSPSIWRYADFYDAYEYIDYMFRTAHDADPAASLWYNDYGLEKNDGRLDNLIAYLEHARDNNVPIHGVGF
jgi:endo-1,4-beta-xylanase